MTQVCCPRCRLRFTGTAAASLEGCPQCGESPNTMIPAEELLGFQLYAPDQHPPNALLRAVAAARRDPRETPS
jgi:hypothetical protein